MSQGHATGNEKVASSRVAGRIILSCGGRRSVVGGLFTEESDSPQRGRHRE